MVTLADVRKISMALPEVLEGGHGFGFGILIKGKHKGFVWSWKERVTPKKPRVELQIPLEDAWRCLAPKHLVEKD